jgi:protein-S-isoprenylcysteine O-methyltransferase Ste14
MNRAYEAWAARWRVPLGFALGIAYLMVAQPTVQTLIPGVGLALSGLALRAFAAGSLQKDAVLATGGPYRYSRNPLYLGSFLMGLGFAVAGRSWLLGALFLVFFCAVYWPVMRREESFLRSKFGAGYDAYARRVPLFLPWLPQAPQPGEGFRWAQYRANREYEAAIGFLAGLLFLLIKMQLR